MWYTCMRSGQKNQETKAIIQKLQNVALRKTSFKQFHHSIKNIKF